jgi:hypothetical protein
MQGHDLILLGSLRFDAPVRSLMVRGYRGPAVDVTSA